RFGIDHRQPLSAAVGGEQQALARVDRGHTLAVTRVVLGHFREAPDWRDGPGLWIDEIDVAGAAGGNEQTPRCRVVAQIVEPDATFAIRQRKRRRRSENEDCQKGTHALKYIPFVLPEVVSYFFKLGWLAFGGPVGQVGLMHLDCVERRGWISEEEFVR